MQANRDNLQALLKRAPRKGNKFEFLRRVKFGRSKKKFKVLLTDFDEYRKELERSATKSEQLEPYRAPSRSVFSPPLPQIRSNAKSIHNVLCVGMSCQASHKARLWVENRIATTGKARFKLRAPTESEQGPAVCSVGRWVLIFPDGSGYLTGRGLKLEVGLDK